LIFFKNRRKLRTTFGALTGLLLFLVFFLSGPVTSVENSDSAKNLVPTILKNVDVQASLSNRILDQVAEGADAPVTNSINSKRAEFVSTISSALTSPATIAELQNDVEIGYQFLTTNEPTTTLQLKPLIASLISALSQVDPQFKDAKKVLSEVKPMTLTRDASTPQIGEWISYAFDLYIALILLLVVSIFFYVRFSANAKHALRGIGTRVLVVGVLSIAQFIAITIIATKIAKNTADTTIQTVIPVAARALFSYYQSIGIALIVLGTAAVLIATRLKTPIAQSEPAFEVAYAPM